MERHRLLLDEICMNAINKIADQPNNAIETYKMAELKWKAHVRKINSDNKRSVELKESAFETKMDAYAKELKMRKKLRAAKRGKSKGLFNDIWAWLKQKKQA